MISCTRGWSHFSFGFCYFNRHSKQTRTSKTLEITAPCTSNVKYTFLKKINKNKKGHHDRMNASQTRWSSVLPSRLPFIYPPPIYTWKLSFKCCYISNIICWPICERWKKILNMISRKFQRFYSGQRCQTCSCQKIFLIFKYRDEDGFIKSNKIFIKRNKEHYDMIEKMVNIQ